MNGRGRGSRLAGSTSCEASFGRSVEHIGIGALPFLPGETGYVVEWLRGVLEE